MKLLPSGVTGPDAQRVSARRPVVVLVERDPYLAFLIRLHVPEAEVIEADSDVTATGVRELSPDLVVAGVEDPPFPVGDLLGSGAPKVLVVVDGARAARSAIPSAVEGILARPFAPTDVARATRSALGLGFHEAARPAGPTVARLRSWLPPFRVGALALTAVLEISNEMVSTTRAWILALAFVYATLRWVLRRPTIVWASADLAVATALVAATGAISSSYLPFAAVVVAGTGLMHGPSWGILGGGVVLAGTAPVVLGDVSAGLASAREAAAWAVLMPLIGVTGGFAARVWREPTYEGLDVLVEANRVLSSLYRIARTLPGGLEIGSIADATMHEIRDALGARAGAMMLADSGSFAVVGSFGIEDPSSVLVRDPRTGLGSAIYGDTRVLRTEDLHPATVAALGEHLCWLTAPMRREGIPHGLLLAACPDEDKHDANGALLRRLAEEATVAVENARLFSQVREISIDEERQRLARELHDGIAQALTHLRYELDFMARHSTASDPVRRDVTRLTRVVDRTAAEVRSMILGLRASVAAEGLVGSLRSYLGDLKRLGGPEIVFDARGEVRLPHDIETEIFRVAQEAVSNALRHANAGRILVRLESGQTHVRLIVDDDGIGLNGRSKRKAGVGGVGLSAMRERAELIGATFDVGPRDPRGTRVTFDYPIKRSA